MGTWSRDRDFHTRAAHATRLSLGATFANVSRRSRRQRRAVDVGASRGEEQESAVVAVGCAFDERRTASAREFAVRCNAVRSVEEERKKVRPKVLAAHSPYLDAPTRVCACVRVNESVRKQVRLTPTNGRTNERTTDGFLCRDPEAPQP